VILGAVDLSVVVPVYGCEGCIRMLHERLTETLDGMALEYELVFVDDGSRDRGWQAIAELAERDPHLVALKLSRNFGQHAALTAGLTETSGDWVVVMDCDLQHPPEEIPRLYRTALEGFGIVFTRRRGGGHSWFRKTASRAYFSLMNFVLATDIRSDFSNFSIMSRQVVDEFLRVRDRDRQYLMILHWLGFRSTAIEFQHADRYAGTSTYSLSLLVRFALDGLFFQTTLLLRWIVYVGFAVSAGGAGLAVFFVVKYFVSQPFPYPGWTSLVVLLLLIGGFIIVTIGVTALYVGKIFSQVKERPLYIIETRLKATRTHRRAMDLAAPDPVTRAR
jgi:polyisoprenyl-phosphate glycosyltransferase